MIYLYVYLAMIVGALCTMIALTAMRRREKHNVGKVGWLLLVLVTPPIGLILFVLLGGKRVSAEHDNREVIDFSDLDLDSAAIESALAEIGVRRGLAPPTANNRMRLLTSPSSMHDALFSLIESAEHKLYLHSFILIDDRVGRKIVELLCEKARSGVEVRLMVDGFGSFFFDDDLLERIAQAGGHSTRFKQLSKLSRFAYSNFRNHRKMLIADGNRALIGGANFVEYEMTTDPDDETWVDYALKMEGDAARQIEAVFVSDWNFTAQDHAERTVSPFRSHSHDSDDADVIQVIPSGPDGPTEILDDLWLTAVNRAKQRVWIVTPYFVPPPMAMRSLAMAVRRGVDVRIIVPKHSDLPPADYARHNYAVDLQSLGAKIMRFPDRMVHAKMLVVDREVVYGGSANFDMRSFFLNYELVVGVFNPRQIDEMSSWFEKLAKCCDESPIEETRARKTLSALIRIVAGEL